MQIQQLGTSGPHVTRVGFGAWAIGGPSRFGWGAVDDDESVATLRHAVEAGINWVDTAAFYGRGHSEIVVGRALSPWRVGEEVYVSTKCGLRWQGDDPDAAPENNLRPESIREECERSLQRLGLERIDLYQFHWPDSTGTPVEDSWATMVELVEEGKVRWIGVSNFDCDLLDSCEAIRHVNSVQPPLSLIDPGARDEVIPWCRQHGTGVIVYSPMASGILTGAFDAARAAALPPNDWRSTAPQFNEPALTRNLQIARAVGDMAQRLGTTPSALAVAWTLSLPGVTAAIVGARRPDQVDDWVGAPDLRLAQSDLAELEALISPVRTESPVPEGASA
jgi:aryl-alcohol dehydrogenase-like predicted oxidoreductase